MDLLNVVKTLDEEFDVENVFDDWSWNFDNLFIKYSLPQFRKPNRNTGLMIKNSNEVNKIYTAFSPSRYVLESIRLKGIVNSLLIVKHPFDWDGRRHGEGFIKFKDIDYQLMEGMGISIYSLHTPMDKNRNDSLVSTAHGFAKAIKFRALEEFAIESENNPHLKIGIIGKVNDKNLNALTKRLSSTLNYKVKVRKSSDEVGKVAIVTGGGFVPRLIQEAKELGVTTYLTGIITPNDSEYSKANYKKTSKEIQKIDINVIGCSHYLTEKWAMQYSIPFFSTLCKSEFVEDKEALNVLE